MLHSSSLGFIDIFCETRLVISTQDSIPSKICYVSLIFSVNQHDWSILYYHMWHSTVKFCFPYYTQGMQRVLGKVKNHELVHNGQPRSQLLYFYRLVFLPGMMQFILFYSEENILGILWLLDGLPCDFSRNYNTILHCDLQECD